MWEHGDLFVLFGGKLASVMLFLHPTLTARQMRIRQIWSETHMAEASLYGPETDGAGSTRFKH